MDNKPSIWQKIYRRIQRFCVPRLPRWLASWGLSHVCAKCMTTEDWATGTTVDALHDRWHVGIEE